MPTKLVKTTAHFDKLNKSNSPQREQRKNKFRNNEFKNNKFKNNKFKNGGQN